MSLRPPRDIAPQTFFEQWLPGVFATEFNGPPPKDGVGRDRPKRGAADVRVRVRLEGDGGGAWDLAVAGGALAVGPAASDEPAVTVTQTVADWRAVTVGEEGAVDLAPPEASPLDVLFVDSASRQVLHTVRGTVRFEVTEYNGRTWALTVKLGEQAHPSSPDATISVDAETYGKLLSRKMPPPEAYFSGKIKLFGNTGLAMQLGMALMPRFM